jgi:hypothetical protein
MISKLFGLVRLLDEARAERHLRTAVKKYIEHYHLERNHQGLNNRLIENNYDEHDGKVEIGCHERLGGVLKYYHRLAA